METSVLSLDELNILIDLLSFQWSTLTEARIETWAKDMPDGFVTENSKSQLIKDYKPAIEKLIDKLVIERRKLL